MKARRSEIDSVVKLLLYSFRNDHNLPFVIPTKTCPDLKPSRKEKRRACRKKHSEIVVEKFLPETKQYRCLYYGMHTTDKPDVFDQEEDIVKMMIKRSLKKKKYGGKTLLEIRKLKKLLKKTEVNRTLGIFIRVSVKEKKSIVDKAKNRDLETSDYIRMKLFC